MNVTFKVVTNAIFDGKEYGAVDDKTMERLKKIGLGEREVYKRLNTFNFVSSLTTDEQAIERLKQLIPEGDTKPILFELTFSVDTILDYKYEHRGHMFGGQMWTGCVVEHENAWLVRCTNSYR